MSGAPVDHAELDPQPSAAEIYYLIRHVNRYLHEVIGRADVRATFARLRPRQSQSGIVDGEAVARTFHRDLGNGSHHGDRREVAHIVYAARNEMARTVDDVLARRTRALFLDEAACLAAAPEVGRILGAELGESRGWIEQQVRAFTGIAKRSEAELA